jgi:RNA polymerase sigma factor (TIGR02999 family)
MNPGTSPLVSQLLQELRAGKRSAFDELIPLVYDELHQIAARQRRRWEGNETFDTTALVHEAYLKLAGQAAPEWQNRAHFLGVASTAMRQILIDYAKRRSAARRGGHQPHVSLHDVGSALSQVVPVSQAPDEILLTLDEALHRLEGWNPRQMRIVECRFFGGMSVE